MNINALVKISRYARTPFDIIRNLPGSVKMASKESFYKEYQRKPYPRRLMDNLNWLLKYKEANKYYTLYGMDTEEIDSTKYIDLRSFMRIRNDNNNIYSPDSETVILRNKLLFYEFMRFNEFNVPNVFAIIEGGAVYDIQYKRLTNEDFERYTNYFIKAINGECASFVKHIRAYNDYLLIKSELTETYIAQESVTQIKKMTELNPGSVSTIRIVTSFNKD